MLLFHKTKDQTLAELGASEKIGDIDNLLDIMADARYNDSGTILIHADSLPDGFFDLKTGIAGEILQKFSNYRMRLAIIGDFSAMKSKSLKDFIRESNTKGHVIFVASSEEAIRRMSS